MEWVQGIDMVAGRMFARAETGEHVDMSRLAAEGVPTMSNSRPHLERGVKVRKARTGGLEVPFHAWKKVSPNLYLDWFDVERDDSVCRQDVFEAHVDEGELRLVVPALVFLRAIFRPNVYLLERAFRPQFVDLIAGLDMAQDPPKLVADPNLPALVLSKRLSTPLHLFAWLYCHPSAREMAGSVHANAMAGRISLALPKGSMALSAQGKKVGDHLLVTDMTITSVIPGDSPAISCDLTAPQYVLRGTTFVADDERAVHVTRMDAVPTRPDGSVELTDSEWGEIGPLLHMRRGAQPKRSQRALADGVLTKLHSGTPWKKIAYRDGTDINARSALNSWTHSGRMDSIFEVLRRRRAAGA